VLLLVALLRESRPTDSVIRIKPTGVRPIPKPLHSPHAA
jgi:hypothetical protein